MAKHRYGFDEDKITRFLKEGRGQGTGAGYRPWLTVQDVSSLGRSTRLHSRKTDREHHLISDNETALFLILDWSENVIDIREQFPLDRNETRRIAADMGVRHPVDPISQTDIVMTTDFLIDMKTNSGIVLVPRSVKTANELNNDRVLEKQEIERRYWAAKVDLWGLVTDLDLPDQRIKNLRWLHEMQSLENMVTPYPEFWQDRCNQFLTALSQAKDVTIKRFIQNLDRTYGFGMGEGLTVLRHLAANKKIMIDLDTKFDIHASINVLGLSAPQRDSTLEKRSA